MNNFDSDTNENKTEHNLKWPYIPDHPEYRFWIWKNECVTYMRNIFYIL